MSTKKRVTPYDGLGDAAFWRRSVAQVPQFLIDPVLRPQFAIGSSTRVATAGSCFAQHISRALTRNGLDYFVAEPGPPDLTKDQAWARNFGVFSARFGNVYTTRQLLQLIDRAFGEFKPAIGAWQTSNGRIVDPFRPQVEPNGFADVDEMLADREEHLGRVREMFEKLNVFVFTLGLTEGWISNEDDAVLPTAPGVAGGEWDAHRYRFHNFTVSEVSADLMKFSQRLRSVNPHCSILFTVSPVPLVATYSNTHVLQATVYSKSVLRVAAEEVSRSLRGVDYFPSYEIITSAASGGRYFEDDLRSVAPEGVDHVMRVFFGHYVDKKPHGKDKEGSARVDFASEHAALRYLVCDEEAIERV